MATPNYALPTPPDNTLISKFPKELRDSNTTIDGVLKTQGNAVTAAKNAAEAAKQAAIDAAGLVGTPPDSAISAAVGATNSQSRHKISRAMDIDKNPALGKLWAALVRCQYEPVAHVALGSSSTAAPNDDVSDRWPTIVNVMMQQRFASGAGAETAMGDVSSSIQTLPGVHGYNLGISGATSRNYLPTSHVTRINAIKPAIVFHAIGSNDAKLGYTAAEVKQNVLTAIATIDAGLIIKPTHVIIHMHERDDADISARWADYREELRAISIDNPHRVAFINIADDFAAIGIPGNDPYLFRKTDRVHLEPAGLHMTAKLIANRLDVATEQRRKRILVRDSFDRPNSDMGESDTGQRWLYASGFGINSNQAATAASGGGNPMVETGSPDMDVSVNLTVPETSELAGIVFRSHNESNRYSMLVAGGADSRISLFSHRAGVQINRFNVNYDFTPGTYNIRVTVKGRELNLYVAGKHLYSYRLNPVDEAVLGNYTRAGLRCGANSLGHRWNDFLVKES